MHICRLEDLYDQSDLAVFEAALTAYIDNGHGTGIPVRLRRGVRAAITRLAELGETAVTVEPVHDPVPEMATPQSVSDLLGALEASANAARAARRNKTEEK